MDVCLVSDEGVEHRPAEALAALLERKDGLLWVDIPTCDEQAIRVLRAVFGFHPLAIRDCVERNHVPKIHHYADHLFVVLHASERGKGGHVHLLELDQFIGPSYLVTVHGPVNPAAPVDAALRETRAVRKRIEAGRMHPRSSFGAGGAASDGPHQRDEEPSGFFLHLVDGTSLIASVTVAVEPHRSLSIRRLDEAEDPAGHLIDPVL
jgi:magnesium transporter